MRSWRECNDDDDDDDDDGMCAVSWSTCRLLVICCVRMRRQAGSICARLDKARSRDDAKLHHHGNRIPSIHPSVQCQMFSTQCNLRPSAAVSVIRHKLHAAGDAAICRGVQ